MLTDEIAWSSSNLLNRYASPFPEAARRFLVEFRRRHDPASVLSYLDRARDLRALVVGEAIIDEYLHCETLGVAAKVPSIVARVVDTERFAGGILAVANHVAAFCDRVEVVTQLGSDGGHEDLVREQLRENVDPVLLRCRTAPTIVKRRFLDSRNLTNLLEIHELSVDRPEPDDDRAVGDALAERVPGYDLVIVVDYGHGMLSRSAVEVLSEGSRFLAVSAQANAGNRPGHGITKYPRADYVCMNRRELALQCAD